MIEISLNNIKKSFGFKNILDELSIEIKTGDRVSIIGENGCGKSTLLKIINSLENVDSGSVNIRKGAVLGYLSQQPEGEYNNKEILVVVKSLNKYEDKMNNDPNNIDIINKYLNMQEKFIEMGGYEIDSIIDKVSYGLSINSLLDKEFSLLSGGEQKRVSLAAIIIQTTMIILPQTFRLCNAFIFTTGRPR